MNKEIIAIRSQIKGNFLWIIATFPDQDEQVAIISRDDIREAYEMSHVEFHERFCDNEQELKEIFLSTPKISSND